MDKLFNLQKNMVEYYKGDAKRIQHFTKVHSFAKFIGLGENLAKCCIYCTNRGIIFI